MNNIAIYGAGGLGREVLVLLRQMNDAGRSCWNITGFFDDGIPSGTLIHDRPVLGGLEVLNRQTEPLALVVALGQTTIKKKIVLGVRSPAVQFPTLIHPSVQLRDFQRVRLGIGCVLCAGTILTTDIEVGNHVLLNLHTTVGHDVRIGNYCSLMPGVNISGDVALGEAVYVGTGASLIPGVRVGDETIVGAGAVVTRSLPAHCTAVGVPARPLSVHRP